MSMESIALLWETNLSLSLSRRMTVLPGTTRSVWQYGKLSHGVPGSLREVQMC